MRRVLLIIGLMLITVLIVHQMYEFFATDEGIRYFSSEPRRLLYVMLLGVAGGTIAFGYSRLSLHSQRTLKLVTLGGFGLFLVGGLGFIAYLLCSLLNGSTWLAWEVAGFVAGTWTAGLVWLEFRKTWRQTR